MNIIELNTLTPSQTTDMLGLMRELTADCRVTADMLQNTLSTPGTHLFAALDAAGCIIGCATLGVYCSPTGLKGAVEDVVVAQSHRGQGLGRKLLETIIDYARQQLGDVDLHLTSRPQRIAANALYQSLGFEKRETNFYRMKIRRSRTMPPKNSYA